MIGRVAVALVLALLVATGCSPEGHRAELVYGVTAQDGGAPDPQVLGLTVTELDLRLGEAGYERRAVAAMGPDRIRVVMPEIVADRMDEVRKALETGQPLQVELKLIKGPGAAAGSTGD